MSDPVIVTAGPPVGRRATTRDVASLAGVSRTTVSEIFNGRSNRFPAETVERVHAAASTLRYRPSPAARSLVTGRGQTVLVALPALATPPGFQGVIEELGLRLRERGLHGITQFATGSPEQMTDDILGVNPAGVVDLGGLPTSTRAILRAAGITVVPELDGERISEFHAEIGRMLYSRLVRHSPDRLVYAASAAAPSSPYDDLRLHAMTAAARRDGLAQPIRLDIPLEAAGAAEVLRSTLTRGGRSGVACGTDAVALAVLAGCRILALEVPGEVAVMGVDGSIEGQLVSPRLTSVTTDQSQVASGIVTQFLAALDGLPPSAGPTMVPLVLLPGETA